MQILLCESETMINEMVTEYLSPLGFKVAFAKNESQCLAQIEKRIPDVVILDTHLPHSNSSQTVEKIREKGVKTPVLLMSSNYGITSEEDAIKLGANGFIEKPLKLKDLLTRILELMPN
jgi:DNA-binding response OmpR family regulator